MRITGVMVQYYISCLRELWFYSHGINLNFEDENILIGRLLHETAFKREKKNIIVDDTIGIDFVSSKDGIIIFEMKKSSKLTKPARYQLLYYLYYIRKSGIQNVRGMLVFPNERKREEISLTPELAKEIDDILGDIEKTVLLEKPPSAEKKTYCRKCSYFDFCRV